MEHPYQIGIHNVLLLLLVDLACSTRSRTSIYPETNIYRAWKVTVHKLQDTKISQSPRKLQHTPISHTRKRQSPVRQL